MNNLTEIVFILDCSGSMSGLESDTIGGFNSLIHKQRKEEGDAILSAVLFNSRSKVIYDRIPLELVKDMTEKDYIPQGCTALLDALGNSIQHISYVHKQLKHKPEKTLFVIITDGYENASKEYDHRQIKKMIEDKQRKDDWEFLYLGANIDAIEAAGHVGIKQDRAVNYHCDSEGIPTFFNQLDETIKGLRMNKKINSNWKEKIEEDYNRRK